MTFRVLRGLVAAVACAAAAWAPAVQAQSGTGAVRLLDVPYLAQTESLCGGAAAAMVMRFWGATDVYPETFGSLVDHRAGGIHGKDLVDALHAKGWQATAVKGDVATVRSHLDKGRPIVALIQDRPNTFHYVVLVAWRAGRVVLHDPARAPFRVVAERTFLRAWAASGNWTMLALPPPNVSSLEKPVHADDSHAPRRSAASTGCQAMVDEGVRLAGAGELDEARVILDGAASSCPDAPEPWRELAGIHALQRQWKAAADDARQALVRDGRDEHAARILATSLFLENQRDEALAVWNTLGEPAIDLVSITGLERTRHDVMTRAMRMQRGQPLTVATLARARRRLADVPSVMTGRVSFTPGEDGLAQVDAAVIERSLMPTGPLFLASAGARALTDRELTWSLASPSGGGEVFTVAWRWWEKRPRVGFRFSAPSATPVLGGLWTIDAFDERQTYGAAERLVERRRGVVLKASDWITGDLRWETALGVDNWAAHGTSLSMSAAVEQHLIADQVVLSVRGSVFTHDVRAVTTGARVQWRSTVHNEGRVWLAETGFDLATRSSPLALWAGAGTGQGRDLLLRAHPLLDDGIIDDGVFGRRLTHANVEWRHWRHWQGKPVRIAPAIFVDAAQAYQRASGLSDRFEVDAGAGIRVSVPGGSVLRMDLARGVRDDAMAFSIGWTR